MPAIAPADRVDFESATAVGEGVVLEVEVLVGVDVGDDVEDKEVVGKLSTGNPSPGLNANVELAAYAC